MNNTKECSPDVSKELNNVLKHLDLPTFNPDHILTLTDDTGIIQHATGNIPNRKEGYCLDDNSRALILAILAWEQNQDENLKKLIPLYLSFIHHMQREDGKFINFLNYSRNYSEEVGSEDAYGRTLMALGYIFNSSQSCLVIKAADTIFQKAFVHVYTLKSIRGIANSIIGLCKYVGYNYNDNNKKLAIVKLANILTGEYHKSFSPGWYWYESILSYDNAIIPLSLLYAYDITQNNNYLTVALDSINFLESIVFKNGSLETVGNDGWFSQNGVRALFDQQPIDTMAMILLYQKLYEITNDKRFMLKMIISYEWFMGKNTPGIPLYDNYTGGCSDGLQIDGINYNQGAESTISFWISYFTLIDILNRNSKEYN
jgi:hypothetical protein